MHGKAFKFLLFPLMLAGCAHTAPRPASGMRTEIVTKTVTVTQKCIKKEDIPARPAPLSETKMPSNVGDVARLAMAKLADWTNYGNKVDVVMKGCAN